jgi:hypothetical protein
VGGGAVFDKFVLIDKILSLMRIFCVSTLVVVPVTVKLPPMATFPEAVIVPVVKLLTVAAFALSVEGTVILHAEIPLAVNCTDTVRLLVVVVFATSAEADVIVPDTDKLLAFALFAFRVFVEANVPVTVRLLAFSAEADVIVPDTLRLHAVTELALNTLEDVNVFETLRLLAFAVFAFNVVSTVRLLAATIRARRVLGTLTVELVILLVDILQDVTADKVALHALNALMFTFDATVRLLINALLPVIMFATVILDVLTLLKVAVSDALNVPTISSLALGADVPTPILPEPSIRTRSAPPVASPIVFEAA